MTINEIIELAHQYARARARLIHRCAFIQDAINRIKRANLPLLRVASADAKDAYVRLARAITDSKPLFNNPKTITVDDVKFGLRKQKGKLEWKDEEEVVHRIKVYYPDNFKDLMHVKETPDKDALAKLTGAELKKLGVTLGEDSDAITITAPGNESEKLAAAFLAEEIAEEKA